MRPGWLPSTAVALVATAVAVTLQNVLRDTWQIRTLPERVEEWLLLFVPLDLFERGLAQFGADAKVLALLAIQAGMIVLLFGIGLATLRAGWSSWRLLCVGLGLWLLTMVVVMPVTGAGFFAAGLLISPLLTDSGYLLMFAGYTSVLVAGRLLALRGTQVHTTAVAERRAFIVALAGTVAAAGLARFIGREGGLVGSTLPLASVPTRQPVATTPQPTLAAATGPTTAPVVVQPGQPTPVPQATPTQEPFPNPGPERHLTRDKDGSLTGAGRMPGELAPPITSNEDFYVVTKNAVADPVVDAASWRLVVDGEVNSPVQLDYRTLRSLPAVETTKTLECISNFTAGCNLTSFGCELISTAQFKGVRLSDILDLAGGLKSSAMGLAFLAIDEFSSGLPTDVASDPETLIVYEMNGQPLPREHGFPARLLVPGRYGMKDPKWLAGIRAMNQEYAGWYEQRNWDKDGLVKTMSRIDTPLDGARLQPGEQRVAGIAYAGDRGVMRVDVSPDDGATWLPTRFLEPAPGKDAMVRWEGMVMLSTGEQVTLTVRATDGTGQMQTEDFVLPQPSGASGEDQVTISAA
jgi:DMSO/TMAO reductase YedYZ molybdopterin-dependent catalytic subunit